MNPEWLDRVFGFEGGFSADPADPGNWTGGKSGSGELKGTKWGIAANTYPHLNIKALTREQAADIYARDYAKPFLDLHPALGFQLFDFSVNAGVDKAVRTLQIVLGVTVDGKLGPMTRAAIKDPVNVAIQLLAERLEFYTDIQGWSRFGRGWAKRVAANLRYLSEDVN